MAPEAAQLCAIDLNFPDGRCPAQGECFEQFHRTQGGSTRCGRHGRADRIEFIDAADYDQHLAQLPCAHDHLVARYAATALCDVEAASLVDEARLFGVERKLFVDSLRNEKTLQPIAHTLEAGKPLRN